MHTNKRIQFFATLFFLFNLGYCLGSQNSFLSPEEILKVWESNYGSIRNMKMSCSLKSKGPSGNHIFHIEKVEEGEKFKAKITIETNDSTFDNTEEASFNGKFSKKYSPYTNEGLVSKGLTGKAIEQTNPLRDFLLMKIPPRMLGSNIIPEFANFFYSGKNPGQLKKDIKIHPSLEIVAGHKCHLVEFYSESNTKSVKIWVAHNKGMIPMKFELDFRVTDKNYMRSFEIIEIAMTDKGLWYPVKGQANSSSPRGVSEEHLNVSSFDANISLENTDFELVFPEGTKVYDSYTGINYKVEATIFGEDPKGLVDELIDLSNVDNNKKQCLNVNVQESTLKNQLPIAKKIMILSL